MQVNNYFQKTTLLLFCIGTTLQIFLSMYLNEWSLIYTLDDPYIHLSVSEKILMGGYGVNIEEYSSPSSSIIYSLMLTPFILLGIGTLGPLVLSLITQFGSIIILTNLIEQALLKNKRATKLQLASSVIIAVPLLIALNSFGLPMTGMEHSLHVFSSLLILKGLLKTVQDKKVPLYLAIAIIFNPLIRFEGYALSILAIISLFYLNHRKSSLTIFFILFLATSFYFMVMKSMGLPLLPSSVLVKSKISASLIEHNLVDSMKDLFGSLIKGLKNKQGFILFFSSLFILYTLKKSTYKKSELVITLTGTLAVLAHILAGKYGWFGRYEIYAIATIIFLFSLIVIPNLNNGKFLSINSKVSVFFLLICTPYITTTIYTPSASRNIYEQQYQMHRFATEYFKEKVAVNDLGWVSYQNDEYVLDLWGLGSEKARKIRRSGGFTKEKLNAIVVDSDVAYLMIYDEWFNNIIPDKWCRIGELKTSHVTSASDTVAFYLVNPYELEGMLKAMKDFESTLPSGSKLNIANCNHVN